MEIKRKRKSDYKKEKEINNMLEKLKKSYSDIIESKVRINRIVK